MCLGVRLHLNERGNGNPTGWEWERIILTGSKIIPIHLLNHEFPYRLTVFAFVVLSLVVIIMQESFDLL